MKKRQDFLIYSVIILIITSFLWDFYIEKNGKIIATRKFEKRLQRQEYRAEKILNDIEPDYAFNFLTKDPDILYVGFKNDSLKLWTHKNICSPNLKYDLEFCNGFTKINNTFFEVRQKTKNDISYFALIRIKDDYPYENRYLKNKFADYLGIEQKNANLAYVSRYPHPNAHSIKNIEGNTVCYISYHTDYRNKITNPFLLSIFAGIVLLFFRIYHIRLKTSSSLRTKLRTALIFAVFLATLRFITCKFRIPFSIYRLPFFEEGPAFSNALYSIGDLFIYSLFIVLFLQITLYNIKKDIGKIKNTYKFPLITGLILIAYFYNLSYNHIIKYIIEDLDIHLNIARIFNVDIYSPIAFLSVILQGLGLMIIAAGIAILIRANLSFKQALYTSISTVAISGFIVRLFLPTSIITEIFLCILLILLCINEYFIRHPLQKSIYIVLMLCASVYMIWIAKKHEDKREFKRRTQYAQTLIEERDYNFEIKLSQISAQIKDSELISSLIRDNKEEMIKSCLTEELLDLTGYPYTLQIHLHNVKDSSEESSRHPAEIFDRLIKNHGIPLTDANFYSVNVYDGIISYIGKFTEGETTLFLQFDSHRESEGSGYPQILSRRPAEKMNMNYNYSFAKYLKGSLILASGDFNYYKLLKALGDFSEPTLIKKDLYSHLIIPITEDNSFVISLPEKISSFYYLNILYAFFLYGLFVFGKFLILSNFKSTLKKNSIKTQIKNHILSIVIILFLLLTSFSIFLNYKNYRRLIHSKVNEVLKYVNGDLESAMEFNDKSGLNALLSSMSDLLQVDINIYTANGSLYATSRPEIFRMGIEGNMINPFVLRNMEEYNQNSYTTGENIGSLKFVSAYTQMIAENGNSYILNIPYFPQNTEFNISMLSMVIVAINIFVFLITIAYILSVIIADKITKPMQLVNERIHAMRFDGRNEKIDYIRTDEMGALVDAYNKMVDQLDENIKLLAKTEREMAWREMAQQIAHEIKNPLTPMKLNLQFMQRAANIEDAEDFKLRFKETSDILIKQIDTLASTASLFSDFAKIPATDNEILNLSELVENTVKLFEDNAIRFEYEIPSGIFLHTNKEQISRVLINILKNAKESISENTRGVISVSMRKNIKNIAIAVKDNGTGIPEHLKERIFEPKFTTKSTGSGIGLAISKKIAESMGGEIIVRSEENKGSEFIVLLPLESENS